MTELSSGGKSADLDWVDDEPSRRGGVTTCVCRTTIPADYIYFDGHFRGYPVLAGVVQLHELALPCVRRLRPDLASLSKLSGLKFASRILPGDVVEVLVRWGDLGPAVHFEIFSNGHRCTQGKLQFDTHEMES